MNDPGDPRLARGEAWNAFCDALRRSGERLLEGGPLTAREQAEGFRYLARFLASGLVSCLTHDDPEYPILGRQMDLTRPWGLDSPDCLYLYAPLAPEHTYRLFGWRGTARHLDVQVNAGHFSAGEVAAVRTLSSISGLELEVDGDGHFELYIGGAEREGNWIPTGPDAGFLQVRQIFDDWERELPGDLLIERVGASWPMPPPRSGFVADRLEKLARWIERGGALWDTMSRGILSMEPNTMVIHRPEAAGAHAGTRGQAYGMGHFRCEPGEAVVLSFAPPRCHYWGVALGNRFWECIEFASHQSSLTGAQAELDPDGVFRGVIAQEDPGVPNWLDPAGNLEGTVIARFILADSAPEVRFERVPAERLRSLLPATTPVVSPEERQRRLARRRHAALRRYRR